MNIYAISDLHLSTACDKPMDKFGKSWENYMDTIIADWKAKVQPSDIVILAGDFSWAMRMDDALPDFELLAPLPGHKVILRGNHDYWWNTISQVRSSIPSGFYALQNDCLRIGNVLLCGSRGWVCPDGNNLNAEDSKIYAREVGRLQLSLEAKNKMYKEGDTVIGVMHYPPFNGRYMPSDFVNLFVKHNVDTVVYGHLHGTDSRTTKVLDKFGINFYLTSCDIVSNQLVLIKSIPED